VSKLPRAILFDLDDTILAAFGQAEGQWRRVIADFIEHLAPHPPDDVVAAIQAYSRHLWSDAARHKDWRPRIGAARRHIVARAFAGLAGGAGRPVPLGEVAMRWPIAQRAPRPNCACFPALTRRLDASRSWVCAWRCEMVPPRRNAPRSFASPSKNGSTISRSRASNGRQAQERAYTHAMEALGVVPQDT
jgi:putative hydrolase of the HAD superfamily